MWLAENSVPKMNSVKDGEDGSSDELLFCNAEEALQKRISSCGGKALLYCDSCALPRFAPLGRGIRTISAVAEKDALPLFAMPDGVGAVFAAGGANTLRAARFFAEVRRVPCVIFPTDATLFGAYEPRGNVYLEGKERDMPLAEAEVCIDERLLSQSLAKGYSETLLARLALVEEYALRSFYHRRKNPCYEEAYALLQPQIGTAREIIEVNAKLRKLEREGLSAGEGRVLARLFPGPLAPFYAYLALSSLYYAFFKKGKPRKYFVPDYFHRASQAASPKVEVPSPEEMASRSLTLERIRAPLCYQLSAMIAKKSHHARMIRTFSAEPIGNPSLKVLAVLPELCPKGLSAVIRDFGLMEF